MDTAQDATAPSEEEPDSTIRSGMIAVVGRTNVGKSTLINTILEEKVSIVSHVAQTTRNLIRAIYTDKPGQLVFLDTPGVHRSQGPLGQVMNKLAKASIDGVDLIAFVIDASDEPHIEDDGWMRKIARLDTPAVFIVNKCDKPTKNLAAYETLWKDIQKEKETDKQVDWLQVSALTRAGIDDLVAYFYAKMPVGPYLFPKDVLTDFPRKLAMADVIREKLFLSMRNELPHAIAVLVEDVIEEKGLHISATIYVQRHTQKGIVIGDKGRVLRKVKRQAERELSEMYECDVSVELWVKVDKDWSKNFWMLKRLGYTA